MKNTKLEMMKAEAAPATVQGGKVDFSEVRVTDLGTPAERIRWHLATAYSLGRVALAHAIAAGRELAAQKALLGYGRWAGWCRECLGFSKDTADRYIALYDKTVGAARAAVGLALENDVTDKELDAATVGMEDKSVTGAMVALGVIRRSGKWGGDRRERAAENGKTVGRPVKGSAEEVEAALDAAANYEPAMWASAEGAIRTVAELDARKHLFSRLADDHLALAARLLGDLARKAGESLKARLARRDMGLHGEEMETSEVLKVLERGV